MSRITCAATRRCDILLSILVLYSIFQVHLIFEVKGQQDADDEEPLCFVFVEHYKPAHKRMVKADWQNDAVPFWPHLLEIPESEPKKLVLHFTQSVFF